MRKATVPQKHYGCRAPRTVVEAAMDPAKVAQMAEALNRLAAADALSLLVAGILTLLDEARSLVLQTDRSASMRLSSDCWRSSSLGDIATRADIPEGRCLTFHLEPVDSRLWRFGYFQHACRLLLHLGVQLSCDLPSLEMSRQHPLWRNDRVGRRFAANEPGDCLKFPVRRGPHYSFDRVVELDDLLPNRCHRRAAAIRPSGGTLSPESG